MGKKIGKQTRQVRSPALIKQRCQIGSLLKKIEAFEQKLYENTQRIRKILAFSKILTLE